MIHRLLIFLALFFSSVVFSKPETIDVSSLGTDAHPLIFDLSKKNNFTVSREKEGKIYIKLINLLPRYRDSYSVSLSENKLSLKPFVMSNFMPKNQIGGFKSIISLTSPISPICESIKDKTEKIVGYDDEDANFSELVISLKGDLARSGGTCDSSIRSKANKVIDATELIVTADLTANTELTITVKRDGKEAEFGSMIFTAKPVEWMTHVGFTFVNNKDNLYYSTASGSDYTITKQNSVPDIKYAASVLFTYPFCQFAGNSIGLGMSAGIGAAADSLQLIFGPSVIIGQNFVVNVGASAMQFEKLKGTYAPGQNIGVEPVDSTAMTEKQFDVALSVTLGYRFE